MPLATFEPGSLDRFAREFEKLFYAGDAAAMTAYYIEDAQLMAEGMTPVRGHAAILEFWRVAIARAAAAGARRTIEIHDSSSSGTLGYALSTVTVQIPGHAGDSAVSATRIASWDATIWQHDPSGEWRITVDISTRIAPGA
jgi:ketosteroid isomerase-like protein